MIIPVIGIETLEDYKRKIEEGSLDDRPTRCPSCGEKKFWKHGSYQRKVISGGNPETVRINRYICGVCGIAVTCLFSFLVPYKQFPAEDMAKTIERVGTSDSTYFALAIEMNESEGESCRPSQSQIFRWVNAFSNAVSGLLFAAQKEIMMRNCDAGFAPAASICPAASRTRDTRKRQRLLDISEFVGCCTKLAADGIRKMHAFFLSEVETLQSIFCSRGIELPTPHSVHRLVF